MIDREKMIEVLKTLKNKNVEFVLFGGAAIALHCSDIKVKVNDVDIIITDSGDIDFKKDKITRLKIKGVKVEVLEKGRKYTDCSYSAFTPDYEEEEVTEIEGFRVFDYMKLINTQKPGPKLKKKISHIIKRYGLKRDLVEEVDINPFLYGFAWNMAYPSKEFRDGYDIKKLIPGC